MNRTQRFARTALSLAVSATLAIGPWGQAQAATLQWTGQGTSAFWSDALNWFPQRVPADGEDLVFGSGPLRTSSVFDLARSFSSLTYNADAPLFTTRVVGGGGHLAFTGAGIVSLTAVGSMFKSIVSCISKNCESNTAMSDFTLLATVDC